MKLSDALRAKRSATARLSSLRRCGRRWVGNRETPINKPEFSTELKAIEGGLRSIVDRVNRAIAKVELDV